MARITARVISFLVLIVGWVIIFLGTYYEDDLKGWAQEKTGNDFVGEWSAAVIMTVINYIIPWLISYVDSLE